MTLTIIARNPYTGQVGAAIASGSDDCVGGSLYMQDGAGIVSVQAKGDRTVGATALSMLQMKIPAPDILARIRAEDSKLPMRQILIVPFEGAVLGFTGDQCLSWAGHIVKRDYVLAANMISSDKTLAAMEAAYIKDMHAPMRRRLFAALKAGVMAGGDVRGHKSAGVVIVGHQPFEAKITRSGQPLEDLAKGFL